MKNIVFQFSLIIALLGAFPSCAQQTVEKQDVKSKTITNEFDFHGRVSKTAQNHLVLAGPGSFLEFNYQGTEINIFLASNTDFHNYVSVELDGRYLGRFRVEKAETTTITLNPKENTQHLVKIYKATESNIGAVEFIGTDVDTTKPNHKYDYKIEFIGNSITVGMGNDSKDIPCGSGEWFDQHNSYWSYANVAANQINAEPLLSAVSGMGMYRNWNTENGEEPIMPEVYNYLWLNNYTPGEYNNIFDADLTVIALGTNDLSEGDGTKKRKPFDKNLFVKNYKEFIENIWKVNPDTKLVITDSPMVKGERNAVFVDCLNTIKADLNKKYPNKVVEVFTYSDIEPTGCGYHPSIKEDVKMAKELSPFLKKVLDEK